MAGVGFRINTPEIATGTSAKTIMQVVAASNHRLKIHEIEVAFQGTSNTADPIQVDVLRQSTAGTMTSLSPVKSDDSADETLQVTAQHTASAEPTPGDVLMSTFVHPQTGWQWQARFGDEILVGGGDRLGIRVTAGADVGCIARVVGEE